MDFTRLKKVLAGLSASAIVLTQVTVALAAYKDVPAGVWYKEAVDAFVEAGYLDGNQTNFRGGDLANRAEFVKLIVELNGGILSTPPAVPSFDDVKPSAWYYGYMEEAGKEGWVRGDSNCYGSHPCKARANANINRAEAAALIVRAFALEAKGDAPQFVDNPSGQWYTDAIQTSADHCVLQGDDATGRVRPSDNMNRAEMVAMLHRVDQDMSYGVDCGSKPAGAGVSSVTATSSTAVSAVFSVALDKKSAEDMSHYSVTGSPDHPIASVSLVSDKEVAITMKDALEAGKDYTLTVTDLMTKDGKTFSDTKTFKGFTAVPKGKGTLEVSVSSKNPVSDTVPKGAVGVTVLSMDLTASCDDSVTVTDMTLLHGGFGATTDITGVYASANGMRLSRARTIDSKDQSADLHFSSPLKIEACKSATVDILADFSSTATTAAEHNFLVELASDLQTNAKQVTGNFPAKGNTFRVAAVTSGLVTIAARTVSPSQVNVGDNGVVLGKFEISVDSVEDQTIYQMTLQNNGSTNDGDVTNLRIRRTDGTVLTNAVAQTTGDYATFVFDPPFTVLEGDKITLEVVGDVKGGAANAVQLGFEQGSDVFAVGSLYGYGVNGQLYGSQVSVPATTAFTSVSILAGQFTVEINGPPQQTYTRDQHDAVLSNIIFTTGGDEINVRKLFLAIQANNSTGGTLATSNSASYNEISEVLQNVTLRNKATGRTISGVRLTGSAENGQTSGVGTFQIYRFDDFIVKGKELYELKVDFTDNGSGNSPKNGDVFKIQICGEPQQLSTGTNTSTCSFGGLITAVTTYNMQVEGLSTGDDVTDVRPRGTITGNGQRIATANLTVAVKSLATTDVAVKNAKNISLMRFEARAGEAKDLLVTSFAFVDNTGGTNAIQNGQNYTLWVDTDGDGKVDTILQKGETAQSGVVTFSKMTGGGFVVPKEHTVLFEVHSDIAASLTTTALQLRFNTGTTATAKNYIEVQQLDRGSSLSGIKTNNVTEGGVASTDITVTAVASTLYTLVSQGDLFVTQDTTPLRNRQCLAGALCDQILRLQFHSENEGVDVTDLQLNSSGGLANSVSRLELYKEGASTYFALATIGGCGSDDVLTVNTQHGTPGTQAFCAKMQNQQLVVPRGQDLKVIVRPRMKTDVDGATVADPVTFFIAADPFANNAIGSGAVRARGADSSNNLNRNLGNSGSSSGAVFIGRGTTGGANTRIVGNKNVAVLSRITSITNANPDANGTNVPTGIADIGQFKIAAAANENSKNGLNKATLSGVIFNVNATNVIIAGNSFRFYNKANASTTRTCTWYNSAKTGSTGGNASGSLLVACDSLNNTSLTSVNTQIDQGTDATFVLQGNISNAKVSSSATSTLQVQLTNFDGITRTLFSIGTSTTDPDSHFQWIDKDNATVTAAMVFNWVEYPDTAIKSTSYQS